MPPTAMDVYVIIFIYLACTGGRKIGTTFAKFETSPTKIQSIITEPVLLDCPLESFEGFRWGYNEELLFVEVHPVNTKFQDSQKLMRNYSLFFDATSLLHEGIYECKNDTLTVASYLLEVLVPPTLTLAINGRNISSNFTVPVEQPFAAMCYAYSGKPKVNLSWFIDRIEVIPIISTSVQNDVISEVRYTPMNKKGNITCISKSSSLLNDQYITAYYTTYALPKIFISVDEFNVQNGTLYVAMGDVLTLTCRVHGPKYITQLFWAQDGRRADVIDDIQGTKSDGNDLVGEENFGVLRHTVQRKNQDVSCIAVSEDPPFKVHSNITLITYVIPSLGIYVNNTDVSGSSISLYKNEDVVVSCIAYGALPSVDLYFQTDDGFMYNTTTIIQRNEKNSLTYNTHSYIVYRQTKSNGKIKCIAKGVVEQQQQYGILFTSMKDKDKPEITTEVRNTPIVPVLIVSILLLVGGLILGSVYKRLDGVSLSIIARRDGATYEHSLQDGVFTKIDDSGLKDSPLSMRENFPMASLPLKYQRTDSGEYQTVAEYIEDFYSEMRDIPGGRTRVILQKDICFITCLKQGNTYSRWMGTVSTNQTARKCVFITTIPETPSPKYMVNWDKYVKRILELPEAPNITKLLGICTDKDSLLLLHEHVDGEPLANSISTTLTTVGDDGKRMEGEAVVLIKGILSGMELIHSFGFVHPGLSLKKILLTNNGICKLYDFRLPDDCCRKVICMKEMINCSLNELSPESLMRNEYDQDSDKWSVGVVTWQILTRGYRPFNDSCSDGNFKPTLPDDWPYKKEGGIVWTNLLYKLWSFTPFERPSVRNVRLAFEEMLETSNRDSETYGYTSMEDK